MRYAFALITTDFIIKEEGIRISKEGIRTRDFFASTFRFTFLALYFSVDTLTSLTF